jgi:hypothetical protein
MYNQHLIEKSAMRCLTHFVRFIVWVSFLAGALAQPRDRDDEEYDPGEKKSLLFTAMLCIISHF